MHHQRSYPIKKRKYFEHISDSVSDDYRLRSKMQRGRRDFSFVLIPLPSFYFGCIEIRQFTFAGSRAVSTMKGPGASFVSSDSHGNKRISTCL